MTYKLVDPEGTETTIEANSLSHANQIAEIRGRDEIVYPLDENGNVKDDHTPPDGVPVGNGPHVVPFGHVDLVTREGFEELCDELEGTKVIAWAAIAISGLLLVKELFRK
jgi:hypothetical protein